MHVGSQMMSPCTYFTKVSEKPIKLWMQTGRLYVCHALWIKRGQFQSVNEK